MLYKVFLVDDEPLLLNAITELLPWEEYGFTVCGTAASGQAALDSIYESAPHLLITDIVMPGMDGLELLKNAKLRFPKMKVILLSGYDEFRYVQKALQFGAADYILKPTLDASQMLLLLRQLFPEAKRNNPQGAEGNLIESLLEGDCQAHHVLSKGPWVLAAIVTKAMSPHAKLEVCAALEPFMKQAGSEPAKRPGSPFGGWVLTQPDAQIFLLEDGSAADHLEKYLRSTGITGIIVKNITKRDDLAQLVQNLAYLKEFPFFMPFCSVLITEPGELLPFPPAPAGEENSDALVALSQLMLFLQNVTFRDRITPLQLKLRAETVLYDFFVKMEETEENLPLLERITFAENIMELRGAYQAFYNKIMEGLKNERISPSLMEQIISYMEQNYGRNITLHDVATSLHFNYSYLSHYFNTQSTINFKEYLNNVRIEKAKLLLAEGSLSISSVCFRTGFTDHAYFSRVFRRITGLTPTSYKLSAAKSRKEGGQTTV